MKIISMVPSWTETLIAARADVVGRTRFCIHPAEEVSKIPAVGGTKDFDPLRIAALSSDLVILDREENPRSMSEEINTPWLATHVESTQDVPRELRRLADRISDSSKSADRAVAENLRAFASRWDAVLARGRQQALVNWKSLRGVLEWVLPPDLPPSQCQVAYVIWKKPWMLAHEGTFIASMLAQIGAPPMVQLAAGAAGMGGAGGAAAVGGAAEMAAAVKYPEVDLLALPADTVFLFSSEPYPFAKKIAELRELGRPCAVVDGELFSWFGVRSLKFLEG